MLSCLTLRTTRANSASEVQICSPALGHIQRRKWICLSTLSALAVYACNRLLQDNKPEALHAADKGSVVVTAAARKSALALFEGDGEEEAAPQQASTMSRRKQQQVASRTQKQVDKYAVEKELDVSQLQELDDSSQLDLSGQVRSSNNFEHTKAELREPERLSSWQHNAIGRSAHDVRMSLRDHR